MCCLMSDTDGRQLNAFLWRWKAVVGRNKATIWPMIQTSFYMFLGYLVCYLSAELQVKDQ